MTAFQKWSNGGVNFTIDGVAWTALGDFAHPLDFGETDMVLSEDSWSNNGQGMPMMADSGTYMVVKMGSHFMVVHQSEGCTTLEEVLSVDSAEAAIRAFHDGWTSESDPDSGRTRCGGDRYAGKE